MAATKSLKRNEQSIAIRYQCKICDAPAFHSNYGAITCSSCKMFFKRHAPTPDKNHPCRWNGDCQININTRQVCSACRLQKCFQHGMQIELIRCSLTKTHRNKNENPANNQSNRTETRRNDDMQISQLSTLKLLQHDQSTLSLDQWNTISNLVNCFDEYSGVTLARKFFDEQNLLPLKLRYKSQSVGNFLTSNLIRIQRVLERNGDYLSLCLEDRLTLLHHTIKHSSCLGGAYLVHHANSLDDPYFYKVGENLFGESSMVFTKLMTKYFDPDPIVMKLILPIIAFSTVSYTTYRNKEAVQFKNVKQVLRIQDSYVELAWRYMTYRYSYEETVKRFSQILQCLSNATLTIVEVNHCGSAINVIDQVVEQTERIILFNE